MSSLNDGNSVKQGLRRPSDLFPDFNIYFHDKQKKKKIKCRKEKNTSKRGSSSIYVLLPNARRHPRAV